MYEAKSNARFLLNNSIRPSSSLHASCPTTRHEAEQHKSKDAATAEAAAAAAMPNYTPTTADDNYATAMTSEVATSVTSRLAFISIALWVWNMGQASVLDNTLQTSHLHKKL